MSADRRRARQEALVRALAAAELDGLLVTSRANIRYLTGFAGSAGLVAVTRADVLLVTDFRYGEQARAEAGAVARDRKSTRLNSSHVAISYAVFCLKKKIDVKRH